MVCNFRVEEAISVETIAPRICDVMTGPNPTLATRLGFLLRVYQWSHTCGWMVEERMTVFGSLQMIQPTDILQVLENLNNIEFHIYKYYFIPWRS